MRPRAPSFTIPAMRREGGQAVVETALTLPLTLFLILGTIQLFLLFQGRVMAQYAAARATRAGALNSGNCKPMLHSALTALLPTFTPTRTPVELADAFQTYAGGKYIKANNGGHDGTIVWVIREQPRAVSVEDEEGFDLASANPTTLMVRLVFWYPMRIPFANWVINGIARARFGLAAVKGIDPSANTLAPAIATELVTRASNDQFVMPIEVTSAMRMMTPPRPKHFAAPECTF